MQFLKQVKSRTPESIELEFTLAGIGSRTMALMIDYLLWMICLFGLLLIWAFLPYMLPVLNSLQKWVTAVQLLIFFVVYVGYFIYFETRWRGQTPGKRYARIRVIRDDGRNPGLQQAIMRALLRIVDDILFIGMFCIVFSKQEKRLGDWVAGTLVIQEGQVASPKSIEIEPAAQRLIPILQEKSLIAALTPDDFATVRRYLQRYPYLSREAQLQVSHQLQQQISEIIGLSGSAPTTDAHLFIQAIYLIYQQQFRT